MTFTLELTPEEESRLAHAAEREGLEPAEFAKRALGLAADRTMTGAEALAYWEREGLRGVYTDRKDSPELARELRQQEEARQLPPVEEGQADAA